MNRISKNIIFYITILESHSTDQLYLRKLLHIILPQAIIESIYSDDEAVRYFNNCTIMPHLIFLNEDMLNISGKNTIDLIKHADTLHETPIVFLIGGSKKMQQADLDKMQVNHFYTKPYKAKELLEIFNSLNSSWAA